MPIRKTISRILKFLGKAIVGLIALLILLIFIVHLQLVQGKITKYVNTFLSTKTKGRINIDHFHFSLLGDIEIQGLKVWDADSSKIFSVGLIAASANPFDLFSGDLVFGEVRIENVTGHLIENKDGLNIQFVAKAFASTDSAIVEPTPIKLVFKNVILNNIDFSYTSEVDGTAIKVNLGSLDCDDVIFSTLPNLLSIDQVCLDSALVHIISPTLVDSALTLTKTEVKNLFTPDFGIGLGLTLKEASINNFDISYQRDSLYESPKFDPSHLDIQNIQIEVSDILMRKDTLAGYLQTAYAELPCFTINDVGAQIYMNQHQVSLSGFHFTSNTNSLTADFKGWYDASSSDTSGYPNMEIVSKGHFTPSDFACFLSEANLRYFKNLKTIDIAIDGHYAQGSGQLKLMELTTDKSHLNASGQVNDIWNLDALSWEDVVVDASIGSDFKTILAPYIGNAKIPPSIQMQLSSTGNTKRILLDGKVLTTWGNAQAKGSVILLPGDVDLDLKASSEHLHLNEWMELPWLGPIDMHVDVKGKVGNHQDAKVNGHIQTIVLMNEPIHAISFDGHILKDQVISTVSIADSNYLSNLHSDISFAGPLQMKNDLELTHFHLGKLLKRDTALVLSGNFNSGLTISTDSLNGFLYGQHFIIHNSRAENHQDTFSLVAKLSPQASEVNYMAGNSRGNVTSNFDLRQLPTIFQPLSKRLLNFLDSLNQPGSTRKLQFDFQLDNAEPFTMAGIDIQHFSSLNMMGDWDEENKSFALKANTGNFNGYGITMDTFFTSITLLNDTVAARLNANHLFYNTFELGDLSLNMKPKRDTVITQLLLMKDSVLFLGLKARILNSEQGIQIYTDELQAFQQDYQVSGNNAVFIKDGDVTWKDFRISQGNMEMRLDGDLNALQADLKNINLRNFSQLLNTDTAFINKGYLSANLSYAPDLPLSLKAHVDSLILYHSVPITIELSAVREENKVPFQFLLSNATNQVDVHGHYFPHDKSVDATLKLDVNNPEIFTFLYADYLDDLKGSIQGQATIHGPLQKPEVNGYLRFHDIDVTMANPKLTFLIKDDSIRMDNSGLTLNDFKVYDRQMHPLTITGYVNTNHLPAYKYDLKIKADHYALIDIPDSTKGPIKGLLSINADLGLSGNEKDTHIKADITVKDNSNITYTLSPEEDAVLNTIGIVEFVDPDHFSDTISEATAGTVYDSLIATLPDFKLNATIAVEENAKLKVITDPQSGDYFEASGGANLEVSQDRTGNPNLSGTYTIKKGVYRISFYDLVKKTFQLVPGSSINWSGSPESGEMDIKATHTVATNSLGLIGHEIGENEKSIYKRTLEYIVGINIKGTLEKPIITFSLDLPEQDKSSYPVLANKLDRLRLPEFQSELNKQVFGLLVLGGFMPETSVADIDQAQVATTAIYNSVNAILASQLNRFASQYVKGVNIDVGIQSYADYSTPGGKTQTAMDFRVSKSILNDRLSFEVGGDFNLNKEQSGSNTGDNYRGDVAIIYDLTGNGDKQLKLFNNESYDIIYQEIRNTGISLIFIREFDKGDKKAEKPEKKEKKERKKRKKNDDLINE